MTVDAKTLRTWAYLMPPKAFEVAPCACGNEDTQWSEFEGHCWCERCQSDFVPQHGGIFDGPIPVKLAAMLGVRFDRVILATQQVEQYDIEAGQYRPMAPAPAHLTKLAHAEAVDAFDAQQAEIGGMPYGTYGGY